MPKIKCICLATAIILTIGCVKAEEFNADRTLQEIKQKGAKSVIHKYWQFDDHKKSERFVDAISTGTDKWLEVAKLLRAESDAGVTDDLNFAVTLALPKNPAGVLNLLKPQPNGYAIDDICKDPYYEGATDLVTEEKFLQDAETALDRLSVPSEDKELGDLRGQCITGIRADLRSVKAEIIRKK